MNALGAVAGAVLMTLTFTLSVQAQSSAATGADATRLQIAREIMAANGGTQAMETRMRSAFASLADLTASSLPKTDGRATDLYNGLMKYIVDEEIKALPEIIDQTAKAYADNLSEQELRDMLVWCSSPSGRGFYRKAAAISSEMIAQQGPLMKKMMAGAVSKAVDRVCEDAKCTDDDRKTIIAIAQKAVPSS